MAIAGALTIDGLQRQFTELRDLFGAADTQNTRMLGLLTSIDQDRRKALEALMEGDIETAKGWLTGQGINVQGAIGEELGDVQTSITVGNLVDIILRKLKGAKPK